MCYVHKEYTLSIALLRETNDNSYEQMTANDNHRPRGEILK